MPPSTLQHLGEIVDAQGIYHDLSKVAFDAFSLKHPGTNERLADVLVHKPLKKGIAALAEKFGIDPDVYESTDNYAQMAKNLATFYGTKFFKSAGAGKIVEGGAAAAGVELGGGVGGVVGLAVEAAGEWAYDKFTASKKEQSFKRGDWVIVDKGYMTIKEVDRTLMADIATDLGAQFGDSPDLSEMHLLHRKKRLDTGFYVSQGEEVGTVKIFDVMTGEVDDFVNTDVKLLPVSIRAGLDMDDFVSKVRELYFTKVDFNYINSQVSTDPGTEVIYDGFLFNIVSCSGPLALLNDKMGRNLTVPIALLKRSRQQSTGPSYVYEDGKPVENTGFVTTGTGISSGDWIWYQSYLTWVLGVVHIINGEDIVCYLAPTGSRAVAKEGTDEIRLATLNDSEMFSSVKEFAQFKLAAVEGGDTERLSLGSIFDRMTMVEDPPHRDVPVIKRGTFDDERAEGQEFSRIRTGETAKQLDGITEAQDTYGVPLQDEFAQVVEARNETDFGGGAEFGALPDPTPDEDIEMEDPDQSKMYLLGALLAAGTVYYFATA